MEWTAATVLITMVGLFVTVCTPMLRLNSSIAKLTAMLEYLTGRLDKLENGNTENHRRIWNRLAEQEDALHEHEKRILMLERNGKNEPS